jgi:hypothetical protein
MLVDRYEVEDVFARVPELADQTDAVLVQLDHLLDDDALYRQVRGDLARRYRRTPVHGRPSTPGEVILRLLVVKHLDKWSFAETMQRRCAGLAVVLPCVFPTGARRHDAAALGPDDPSRHTACPHRAASCA